MNGKVDRSRGQRYTIHNIGEMSKKRDYISVYSGNGEMDDFYRKLDWVKVKED